MKKITLLVIMIVTAFTLNAQSLVKYHGEINAWVFCWYRYICY